jgi:hypothetical protein
MGRGNNGRVFTEASLRHHKQLKSINILKRCNEEIKYGQSPAAPFCVVRLSAIEVHCAELGDAPNWGSEALDDAIYLIGRLARLALPVCMA